jgi:hypothetical protein
MNKTQKTVMAVCVFVLLCITMFPPWQQAAERETSYRKDLGRGFFLRPPQPTAAGCYFEGCRTAPPSYFHVVLNGKLLFEQSISVLAVSLAALWILSSNRNRTVSGLASRKTRIAVSILIALAVPPLGTVPLGFMLVGIPKQIMHRDELWLIPTILVLVIFGICSGAIYLLVSLALWIVDRRSGARSFGADLG